MDRYFEFNEIKALQRLICSPQDESDSEDDLPQIDAMKLGPGHIKMLKENTADYTEPHAFLADEGEGIWHKNEVISSQCTEVSDPRIVPKYEIRFKQEITAEDIFLGVGFKTPSTASCESLLISIELPHEVMENIALSVEPECIDVRSPKYRLHLPTPHQVDPNTSSASWYRQSSTLELQLKMIRELNAINF